MVEGQESTEVDFVQPSSNRQTNISLCMALAEVCTNCPILRWYRPGNNKRLQAMFI